MKKSSKKKKKNSRVEKVLKKKGDRLYVKWKGYDNSSKSWVDKRYIINICYIK